MVALDGTADGWFKREEGGAKRAGRLNGSAASWKRAGRLDGGGANGWERKGKLNGSAAGWLKKRRRWRYWLGESGRLLDIRMVVALLVGREKDG